jgi:hypothetical protein
MGESSGRDVLAAAGPRRLPGRCGVMDAADRPSAIAGRTGREA